MTAAEKKVVDAAVALLDDCSRHCEPLNCDCFRKDLNALSAAVAELKEERGETQDG